MALAIYVRTLLPGVSFGDLAEAQMVPAQLGVLHSTGYPLYTLLGKLATLVPIGSVAYRMNLLSAVAACAAVGVLVLVLSRLGVRPLIALAAGLALAVTGPLWQEATYAEMKGLHLLLVALLVHRALVWRQERRDRDFLLGGLLSGMALSNHMLALASVPLVVLFALGTGRDRLRQRPILLFQAALLFLVGIAFYLFIPLRALFGPPEVYGPLLTWDGFAGLVTGAAHRTQMHFGTGESVVSAWRAIPDVFTQLAAGSHVAFVAAGLAGALVLCRRDPPIGALTLGLVVGNVYLYANYFGNLHDYLLVTWLVVALWAGVAANALVDMLGSLAGGRLKRAEVLVLLLPVVIAAGQWESRDQSRNHLGESFADRVFDALPQDAVLLTYWDALTTLSYEHCIEGRRPDVAFRSFDTTVRVVCDPATEALEDVARERPMFALFVQEGDLDALRGQFELVPGETIDVPYGERVPEFRRILYRVRPREGGGLGVDRRGAAAAGEALAEVHLACPGASPRTRPIRSVDSWRSTANRSDVPCAAVFQLPWP